MRETRLAKELIARLFRISVSLLFGDRLGAGPLNAISSGTTVTQSTPGSGPSGPFACTCDEWVEKLQREVRFRHSYQRRPTELLLAWREGDGDALNELIPLIHGELRRLASRHMRRERPGHTLQATALINEAYLRLIEVDSIEWQNRAHFLGCRSGHAPGIGGVCSSQGASAAWRQRSQDLVRRRAHDFA